jgi:hypothetical protein
MKPAMEALNTNNTNSDELQSELSTSMLNDDDEGDDDEFGVKTGGWCCFTNSLPIVLA